MRPKHALGYKGLRSRTNIYVTAPPILPHPQRFLLKVIDANALILTPYTIMELVFAHAWPSPRSIRIISLAVLLATSQYLTTASSLPRTYLITPLKSSAHKAATWLSSHYAPPHLSLPRIALPRWLQDLWRRRSYGHYKTPEDEQRYWKTAEKWRRALAASDARLGGLVGGVGLSAGRIPLVMSYVPRLLPRYRDPVTIDEESTEYPLAPSVYRKWHRMVYPGKIHPTTRQAAREIKNFSSRDRKEIYRITRMLPDEVVFRDTFVWTATYRDIWTRWLDTKGPDIAIVFE